MNKTPANKGMCLSNEPEKSKVNGAANGAVKLGLPRSREYDKILKSLAGRQIFLMA
jgi:hypothetical protein